MQKFPGFDDKRITVEAFGGEFHFTEDDSLLQIIYGDYVYLVLVSPFPVASDLGKRVLFEQLCKEFFQKIALKCGKISVNDCFKTLKILSLYVGLVFVDEPKPKRQKIVVDSVFLYFRIGFGADGLDTFDDPVVMFETVQMSGDILFEDGLYLGA